LESVKEITKLGKTSLSDFKLHTEERKVSVLPGILVPWDWFAPAALIHRNMEKRGY